MFACFVVGLRLEFFKAFKSGKAALSAPSAAGGTVGKGTVGRSSRSGGVFQADGSDEGNGSPEIDL